MPDLQKQDEQGKKESKGTKSSEEIAKENQKKKDEEKKRQITQLCATFQSSINTTTEITELVGLYKQIDNNGILGSTDKSSLKERLEKQIVSIGTELITKTDQKELPNLCKTLSKNIEKTFNGSLLQLQEILYKKYEEFYETQSNNITNGIIGPLVNDISTNTFLPDEQKEKLLISIYKSQIDKINDYTKIEPILCIIAKNKVLSNEEEKKKLIIAASEKYISIIKEFSDCIEWGHKFICLYKYLKSNCAIQDKTLKEVMDHLRDLPELKDKSDKSSELIKQNNDIKLELMLNPQKSIDKKSEYIPISILNALQRLNIISLDNLFLESLWDKVNTLLTTCAQSAQLNLLQTYLPPLLAAKNLFKNNVIGTIETIITNAMIVALNHQYREAESVLHSNTNNTESELFFITVRKILEKLVPARVELQNALERNKAIPVVDINILMTSLNNSLQTSITDAYLSGAAIAIIIQDLKDPDQIDNKIKSIIEVEINPKKTKYSGTDGTDSLRRNLLYNCITALTQEFKPIINDDNIIETARIVIPVLASSKALDPLTPDEAREIMKTLKTKIRESYFVPTNLFPMLKLRMKL